MKSVEPLDGQPRFCFPKHPMRDAWEHFWPEGRMPSNSQALRSFTTNQPIVALLHTMKVPTILSFWRTIQIGSNYTGAVSYRRAGICNMMQTCIDSSVFGGQFLILKFNSDVSFPTWMDLRATLNSNFWLSLRWSIGRTGIDWLLDFGFKSPCCHELADLHSPSHRAFNLNRYGAIRCSITIQETRCPKLKIWIEPD